MCDDGEHGGVRRARPVRICAVGYGKLGGMELGYSSDLDLVFLHDSRGEQQETDAAKPLDNQVFFIRLAQRIVHLLTVHSRAGRLYEVDQRLRPSGKGGMLVTNIEAFAEYQNKEAWTWEHQALLHARAVAGSPELRARFEAVRMDALRSDVRRDTLRDGGGLHARAHAPRAHARQDRRVRHQAGRRRYRRHRVPGAVLGAAVGEGEAARGDVLGHHPAAGVGRVGGPGAPSDGGRA